MWITREHPWKDFFVERVGFTGWKILSTAWIKKWKTFPFKLKIINSLWKRTFLKPPRRMQFVGFRFSLVLSFLAKRKNRTPA